MVADNIPEEENLVVNRYIIEDIRAKIFDKYFANFVKYNKWITYDPETISIGKYDCYSYHPRINGVPLEVVNEKKHNIKI